MTAIDFATHLAKAFLTAELSQHESATLIAIAAGLDTARDIARFLDQSTTAIHSAIAKLTKRKLIHPATWLDDGTPVYRLTPEGKDTLRTHFFSAIPQH